MPKRQINNNIRTLRFLHDELTQKQLAEHLGVTRQTVIAIEKNKYPPSLELAFEIALFFDTTLDKVFTYDLDETITISTINIKNSQLK